MFWGKINNTWIVSNKLLLTLPHQFLPLLNSINSYLSLSLDVGSHSTWCGHGKNVLFHPDVAFYVLFIMLQLIDNLLYFCQCFLVNCFWVFLLLFPEQSSPFSWMLSRFNISAEILLKSHRSKDSLLSCSLFLFILSSMMFAFFTTDH